MRKGFKKNKKGFTLIELIIVIAILAILAAVAIPNFIGLQDQANRGKEIGNATAIVTAVNTYNAVYSDKLIGNAAAYVIVAADITAMSDAGFWPSGIAAAIADADTAKALARVKVNNALATVDTAS